MAGKRNFLRCLLVYFRRVSANGPRGYAEAVLSSMSNKGNDQRETALQALVARYEGHNPAKNPLFLSQEEFEELLVYYYGRHDFEQTLEVADLAISQFAFTPEFYKWKALIHKINLEEDDALETLEKLSTYAPKDEEALMLRLEVLTHFDRVEPAREVLDFLQNAVEGNAKRSLLAFFDGLLLMQESRTEESWHALREAVRLDAYQEPALDELLNAVEFEHLRKDLGKFFRHLLDRDPFNGLVWYYLGLWYDDAGRDTQAADAFANARSLDPSNPRYDLEYADKLFDLDHYARALKVYAAYFESDEAEESYETFMRVGRSYQMLGHLPEAQEAFIRAVKVDPEMYDTYQYLGECYAAQQKWGIAAYNYGRAVEQPNHTAECWLGLAMCQAAVNEPVEAERAFQRARAMDDHYSDATLAYALFMIEQGREAEATTMLHDTLEDYQDEILLYGIVAVYLITNRRKMALEALNEALRRFYDERDLLREFYPESEGDREIEAMIRFYRP